MNWPDAPGGSDAWGITDGYHDIDGSWHPTRDDTREALRQAMGEPITIPLRWFVEAGDAAPLWSAADLRLADGTVVADVTSLPPDLPWGWHELHPRDGGPMTELVVHPARCPDPGRRQGLAVQIHELWSDDTWETGDLSDVARLAERLVAAGGDVVLLSPLHALMPGADVDPSPYSPSSRRWHQPSLVRAPRRRPADLAPDPSRLIERSRAWGPTQRALDEAFDAIEVGSTDDIAWRAWAQAQGDDLVRFARWSVVAEQLGGTWQRWPAEFRRPDGAGWVDAFTTQHAWARRAERHAWAQWRVQQAVTRCSATGAALVADLAVGFHPDGFDAWEMQDLVATGVTIGAPPDPFSTSGQDWGLPPLVPGLLSAMRFEPWLGTVRAAMNLAAGLRLDHVMGLFRQFWIPPGGTPADGAYVRFPCDRLLAVLALEASLSGTFVVGEDLGTVEPEVRDMLHRRGVLGTRVAWFEPDPRPATWPVESMATLTTHDLPTLAGVWSTDDPEEAERRARLATVAGVPPDAETPVRQVVDAAHQALLSSPCKVRLATADDLCTSPLRPNLPGVVGPPSWCVRLPLPVDEIPLDVFRHGTVSP